MSLRLIHQGNNISRHNKNVVFFSSFMCRPRATDLLNFFMISFYSVLYFFFLSRLLAAGIQRPGHSRLRCSIDYAIDTQNHHSNYEQETLGPLKVKLGKKLKYSNEKKL